MSYKHIVYWSLNMRRGFQKCIIVRMEPKILERDNRKTFGPIKLIILF